MPLLPGLELTVAVEPREDPPEQTESGRLAPTVRITAAGVRPGRLSYTRNESEEHVAEQQRPEDPSHRPNVERGRGRVKASSRSRSPGRRRTRAQRGRRARLGLPGTQQRRAQE